MTITIMLTLGYRNREDYCPMDALRRTNAWQLLWPWSHIPGSEESSWTLQAPVNEEAL